MFHTRRDSSIKIGGLFQESEGEKRQKQPHGSLRSQQVFVIEEIPTLISIYFHTGS